MLVYSAMFGTMLDQITADYIMEHIQFTENHASISATA